ncbi:MAG: AMP-binding protein [Polyangiaceae bacterium]
MQQLPIQRFAARTLPALLRLTTRRVGTQRFLREISSDQPDAPPSESTFAEFERAVAGTAEFLRKSGLAPRDRVLFLAENSGDYQILQLAAQTLRAEPCALFASLGEKAACALAERLKPRVLFVSSQAQFDKLETVMGALRRAGLELVIVPRPLDRVPTDVAIHRMQDVKATPFTRESFDALVDAVEGTDPFLLLFTSGTAGKQKGVRMTQDAFVRALEGGRAATAMTEADDGLMFLPFGHVAGQCQFMLAIAVGHALLLVSRREDLPRAFLLGPTYAFSVPMVYEKLKERVEANLARAPKVLRALLTSAVDRATTEGNRRDAKITDRALCALARLTVGRKLRRTLGGRLRMVASGGAAAAPSLAHFFEAMGIPFMSFYGMSETCGLIASHEIEKPRDLASIGSMSPDLEWTVTADGELCVKGPMLMSGYLDEADNRESFDERGFFHTGDLVQIDEATSTMRLNGRRKSLILLSTGKKLSPEPIEARLSALPFVEAALLFGDGRPYVGAILFVRPEELENAELDDTAELDGLLKTVHGELEELSGYERPKRLLVIPSSPSQFPDFVTPTLKLKRASVVAALSPQLDAVYAAPKGPGLLHSPLRV